MMFLKTGTRCIRSIWLLVLCLIGTTSFAQREYIQVFDQIKVNYQNFGFAKMAAAPDGGWAVAESDSMTRVVRLLRFDACGEIRWAKEVSYPISFKPYRVSDIVFDSVGHIYLGTMHYGSGQSAFHLAKLDDSGGVVWVRLWGETDFGPGVFKIGFLPGDRIYFVGWCNPTGVVSDMIGVVNTDGDLLSLRRYYTSTIGYHTVATALRNGHLLMRRGDRFYEVDPISGQVIWMTWNIAPLYNSVIPIQLDSGFLVVGQFANSKDLYSAVPVFLDEQGAFVSRGELFRANGGSFSNVENLALRRVEPLGNGQFVTVTTDSLNTGYLSVVIFDAIGDLVKQIYINPDPGQFRLLNHDFCLLPNGKLAIAANVNGNLAMVLVQLEEPALCGSKTVLQPIPYSTFESSQTINFQPIDYVAQEVPITLTLSDLDPGALMLCDELPLYPDIETTRFTCPGDSILADASFPGATNWAWESGDTTNSVYMQAGEQLEVTVTLGCASFVHQFKIEADSICPCPVDFPNLFTPNGDGTNDLFAPVSDCPLANYHLEVFSRWGGRIFSSLDPLVGWDGRSEGNDLPSDTYLFVVSWQDLSLALPVIRRGEITLVR